jgi:cellular retinoic acid-binding protein 1
MSLKLKINPIRKYLGLIIYPIIKTLDVNFLLRKAATVSSPIMEISKEGDDWTIKTSTSLKSMELKFEIDKEFEETTADGREVTACVTLEGNKLVTVQKAKKAGEKSTKSIREFNGDEVVQTMTIDGVDDLVCVQKFKRIS